MRFILDKDVYKVARVTGPEHNLLGIRLADDGCEIDVVQLPIKVGECNRIDRDTVLAQVKQGLTDINAKLGKSYAVSQVFFVPSDTPSTSVYRYLTAELIKRIDSCGAFLITSPSGKPDNPSV